MIVELRVLFYLVAGQFVLSRKDPTLSANNDNSNLRSHNEQVRNHSKNILLQMTVNSTLTMTNKDRNLEPSCNLIDGSSIVICQDLVDGVEVLTTKDMDTNATCIQLNGIPCSTSFVCPNGNVYSDCRNVDQVGFGGIDCLGNTLSSETPMTNFENGNNGCSKVSYNCAQFSASGYTFDHCRYFDILGDGSIVSILTEGSLGIPVSCWVDIGNVSCTSCSTSTDCSLSGEISYDCSNLSSDPCAVKTCGSCSGSRVPTPTAPITPTSPTVPVQYVPTKPPLSPTPNPQSSAMMTHLNMIFVPTTCYTKVVGITFCILLLIPVHPFAF